jgi:GNAT superfamily N-acetyltransferase
MAIDTILNDGTPIRIRRVRAEDEERLKQGIASLSPRSRYLRFFSGMKTAPQGVIDKLVSVDDHDHIAWGAERTDLPERPALGIVHAFRDEDDPQTAEYSIGVLDDYHGRGLGRLLTAVVLLDAQDEGYREFAVDILGENTAALYLARSLGAQRQGADGTVTEFEIDIAEALASLRKVDDVPGLPAIFAAFDRPEPAD